MIETQELTKRYGGRAVVEDLSFSVRAGRVTGFLGPNGAGKSTTMRLILGLDHPDSGRATISGRPYRELAAPLRAVGALLDAKAVHPGRSAYDHLLHLARSQALPRTRVQEVLEIVGLGQVARRRAGGFSLGMGQRLGVAAALLGDPGVLVLDEPVNGLDPEGVVWIRELMRKMAAEGRTVFVSSHLMNEMAVTADHVIVIGRGRVIADCGMDELLRRDPRRSVLVRTPDAGRLGALVAAAGGDVTVGEDGALSVARMESARISELALDAGIVLHELTPRHASLEDAFMELTRDSVEYADGDRSRA
ncbi:ATP-binding cassette domain-containing protein [Streptosporangium sp. DT93]|uniref:ATP-binding cassette domain-containing protein n=1 Tax=Streptosporangium sp. DT93 TaxID=3393428 RepID=UPI003CF04973